MKLNAIFGLIGQVLLGLLTGLVATIPVFFIIYIPSCVAKGNSIALRDVVWNIALLCVPVGGIIFFILARWDAKQKRLHSEYEQHAQVTPLRCPTCKSLDTKLQKTSTESYPTTKTEYQKHRRYDSEDNYIGYTEVGHEVPTTAFRTRSHRKCNECGLEWTN